MSFVIIIHRPAWNITNKAVASCIDFFFLLTAASFLLLDIAKPDKSPVAADVSYVRLVVLDSLQRYVQSSVTLLFAWVNVLHLHRHYYPELHHPLC